MLRPIPRQILSQTMILHVPTSCDSDYNVQYQNVKVSRVHMQDDHAILKEPDNNEVTRRGVIFVDGVFSSPRLDYNKLYADAQAMGTGLRVSLDGYNFEIRMIDGLPDDRGKLHHWELSVV